MSAELIHTVQGVREAVKQARAADKTIGLVPTMGALHAGHGSLIEHARRDCGTVVVSVFVNPIQFDRQDDYDRYPRTLATDVEFASGCGADIVFAPETGEMYSSPQQTYVEVEKLTENLCGASRPGHFRGVTTVVSKLFHIVQPDRAYFGEKDAQQLAVIRRMARDLNMPYQIVGVPIVREASGLALSSRNQHLSPAERAIAPAIYCSLLAARACIESGVRAASDVKNAAHAVLAEHPELRVEYFEIVDPEELQPVNEIRGPVLVAAAVWLGKTRLIDNVTVAPRFAL